MSMPQAQARLHVDLRGVPMVGDALRDIQAAVAVGARPILVKTGKGTRTLEAGELPEEVAVFEDLREAANVIISETD